MDVTWGEPPDKVVDFRKKALQRQQAGTVMVPLLGRINGGDKPATTTDISPGVGFHAVRAADRQIRETGPLLVSPENPGGWTLADVLYRLHHELEAQHRAMTFSGAHQAAEVLSLQKHMLHHVREAEILAMQISDTLAEGGAS